VAAAQVIVDESYRLHGGVRRGGSDEDQANLLQRSAQFGARRCDCRDIGHGSGSPTWSARGERPHQLLQRAGSTLGPKALDRQCVRDRGIDLGSVADDPCIGHQPDPVKVGERGDRVDVEVREGGSKTCALAQDGQPGQTALESLERNPLEDRRLAVNRPTPLLVVVGLVFEGRRGPGAASLAVRPDDYSADDDSSRFDSASSVGSADTGE